MTITHQILTDADGKPVAVQIPWDEFEAIQAELERIHPLDAETRSLLDRRSQELKDGTVESIDGEELFRRVRTRLDVKKGVRESA